MINDISSYLDAFVDVLGKSATIENYKKMVLLQLIESLVLIGMILIGAIIVVATVILFLGSSILSPESFEPLTLLSNPVALGIIGISSIIGLVLITLFSLYLQAAKLRLAESILAGKLIGVKEALSRAKEGFLTVTITMLIWSIVETIALIIAFIPALVVLVPAILSGTLSSNPLSIILSVGVGLLGILIFFIISFFISPFASLLFPIALFENKGVSYTFGQALARAKKNYLPLLVFIIGMFVVAIAIGSVQWIFDQMFSIFDQLIMIGMGIPIVGILVLIIAIPWFLIRFLIGVLFAAAMVLASSVLIVKMYYLTLEKQPSSKVRKK